MDMEGFYKEGFGKEKMSLVEQKRQEAFASILEDLEDRLGKDIGQTFEAGGRSYEITSPEDCMVAYAQQLQEEVAKFHSEIILKEDYRQEQATAKLLALFKAYQRLIELYSELRSYYPSAADIVSGYLPSLTETAKHGEELWGKVKDSK